MHSNAHGLYLAPTGETPEVCIDPVSHRILIQGESYPENALAFYAPIRASLQDYLGSLTAQQAVEASFSLRYFNSSSTKVIRALVGMLSDAAASGKQIATIWLHDAEDDMMAEFGQDLREEFHALNLRVVATGEA